MKRKFVKVMFLGALTLSTVTYVGCKDYDDDIDNLQTQIDANKASIAELQKFVKEGKWVKSVEPITGGFKITFNDGTPYEIVNGAKGDKGDTGATGAEGQSSILTVDPTTGEWLINGEKTGWSAKAPYIQDGYWYYWSKEAGKFVKGDKATGEQGEEGPAGANGFSPYISNGTNGDKGYWYFYEPDNKDAITSGDLKGWVKGAFTDATTTLTKIEDRPCWLLTQLDGDETKEVILPTADNLINIKGVAISDDGKISTDGTKEVTLYYGILKNEVKFGPKEDQNTYSKDKVLTSNNAVINVMVNPVDISLEEYTFTLQNSKGTNTYLELGKPVQNVTPKALTRAESTPNIGLYDLSVKIKDGLNSSAELPQAVYALATKNAWDKTIMSAYDVKVTLSNQNIPELTDQTLAAIKNCDETYVLDDLLKEAGETNLGYVADYYYTADNVEIKKDVETGKWQILSKIGQSVIVTVHYLTVEGVEKSSTLTIQFKKKLEMVTVDPINWTVTDAKDGKEKKVSLEVIKDLLDKEDYSVVYLSKAALDETPAETDIDYAVAPVVKAENGGIALSVAKDAKDKKWYLTAIFDETKVTATEHTIHLAVKNAKGEDDLGTLLVKGIDLKVNITMPKTPVFVFDRIPGYFSENGKGNTAKAYGTPVAGTEGKDKVTYDLTKLYTNVTNNMDNISYAEDDSEAWKGAQWLQSDVNPVLSLPVGPDNIGKEHGLIVSYQPYGNKNLAAILDEFNLTVLSEIAEGTEKETVSNKYLSNVVREFTLNLTDFVWKDYKGESIVWSSDSENRIKSITLVPSDTAGKYMDLSATDFKASTPIKVTLKNSVGVILSPESEENSYIEMKVLDAWGITSTVKIPVPIKNENK